MGDADLRDIFEVSFQSQNESTRWLCLSYLHTEAANGNQTAKAFLRERPAAKLAWLVWNGFLPWPQNNLK